MLGNNLIAPLAFYVIALSTIVMNGATVNPDIPPIPISINIR